MNREYDVLDHGFVRLVDHMGSDDFVCEAARVSYANQAGDYTPTQNKALINYLMRHRHTSPFEQCFLTFHVKLPIFVARQWMRHRTWKYNEISGRYSILPEEFYLPHHEQVLAQASNNKQGRGEELPEAIVEAFQTGLYDASKYAFEFYHESADANVAKELSRLVLPLNTYTEFYASVDLHNLFHFLKLRLDPHAQYEIRVYAQAIADIVAELFPVSYAAFCEYVLCARTLSFNEWWAVRSVLSDDQIDEIQRRLESAGCPKRNISELIGQLREGTDA